MILGVETGISDSGITFKVNPAKAGEWVEQIQTYLQMGMLTSGEASKLAGRFSCPCLRVANDISFLGRLGFASQHIFHRLGRALLVPVYKQIRSRSSTMGKELRMALQWWRNALQKGMSQAGCTHSMMFRRTCLDLQVRPWKQEEQEPLHLLCDARHSTLPRSHSRLAFPSCQINASPNRGRTSR